MSDFTRRGFLGAAAAASLAGMNAADAGDFAFKNNVPDPLLSEKELPTFKFELEKSEGKTLGKSYGKEATVLQLPISKGIAGNPTCLLADHFGKPVVFFEKFPHERVFIAPTGAPVGGNREIK